jgi:glutamate-1-semialdehyde aminotransferase
MDFAEAMIQRGILWAPYSVNIMLAHRARHIDRVVEAAGEILELMAEGPDDA